MINRMLLAALSVCLAGGLLATEAEAGFKVRAANGEWFYYPGAGYVPVPYVFHYILPPGLEEPYPGPGDRFDESYYDPDLDVPVEKPKLANKPAKKKPMTATSTTKTTAAKTTAANTTSTKAAAAVTSGEPKDVKGAMPCDKAAGIVSGYGFTGVKASSCKGQIYAFNAARGGKNFAIKLDAVSGELTEVKKVE